MSQSWLTLALPVELPRHRPVYWPSTGQKVGTHMSSSVMEFSVSTKFAIRWIQDFLLAPNNDSGTPRPSWTSFKWFDRIEETPPVGIDYFTMRHKFFVHAFAGDIYEHSAVVFYIQGDEVARVWLISLSEVGHSRKTWAICHVEYRLAWPDPESDWVSQKQYIRHFT